MSQINLGTGSQGSPPTEAQKQQIRDALDISSITITERDKLDSIETGADVTDTTNVVAALTAGSNITIAADGTISSTDITLSDEQIQDIIGAMVTGNSESGISVTYDDTSGSIVFSVESQTDENFTTADHTKLDGIESGATADQTAAEIKSLVDSATDSNVFTDADHTKLDGIEDSADVTDTANVTSAGALMDSEVTNLAQVKAFDSSDYAAALGADDNYVTDAEKIVIGNTSGTNTGDQDLSSYQPQPSEGAFADGDKTKLDGISSGADVTPAWVPSSNPSYATETYVGTEVSNLVDSAPGTLDTLNELAAALGDDPNFATTVSTSIGTKLPLAGGTMTGNIVMSGSETVDGRDLSVDGAKLDGIEAGATADQTSAEIKTAYENNADTNAFTDADHTKLDGIETGADVTDTDNVVSALTAGTNVTIAGDGTISSTNTNTQLSDEEVQDIVGGMVAGNTESGIAVTYDDTDGTLDFTVASQTDENFTTADHTKLDGVEAGATADQTGAEIKSLYEGEADTNAFTDAEKTLLSNQSGTNTGDQDLSSYQLQPSEGAFVDGDKTKLDGIESGADVTDTANVTAAGALMDSEVTNLDQVKAFDSSDYAPALGADDNYVTDAEKIVIGNTSGTNTGDQDLSSYQLQPSEGAFVDGDKTKLDGIESGATADQTGAEIKTAYEGETDTNAFTDSEKSKLGNIEASADVTDTTNVVAALTAGTNVTIAGDGTVSSTDTNTQLSDEEVQDVVGGMVTTNSESGISVTYDDTAGKLDFSVTSQTDENFTTADHAKLDGIEANATADQTAAEIKSLVDSATDSNVFTDADHTKLDGISSGADVTPAWVPSSDPSYATETYVDTEVSNLVDAAPGTLDTLNELAAALGDDPNFSTTVTNNIASKLPLAGGTMTGNIVMSGSETVDGRDLSVDGAKLDGIESGATADQTASEIRSLVDSATDSNVFTDADHTKLDGIEASADVTDTDNVVSALTAGTNITIAGDGTISSTDTNTQLSDEEVQDVIGGMVTTNSESGISVTYDDTGGKLDFSVTSQTDENFTTADHAKLDGIEAGADVTDTANVTAAGALMDSEVTNLADVKAFDPADYAAALGADDNYVTDAEKVVIGNTSGTNTGDQDLSAYQLEPSEGAFVDGDKTKLDGIEAGATGDQDLSAYQLEPSEGAFVDGDKTKLDGIEAGATADQTAAEIKTAYESNANTNAFTDADNTKLAGISSGADVTPAWVPSSDPSYATQTYVDTEVSNLIDAAPGTLDTLNELAAALGDDADFSTTITNSIATKLPLAGGTMTGSINMDTNDITNVGKITVVNTSTDDSLLITSTEDSSDAAPVITLKRNSSTISSGDYLGQLKFKGENDADEELVYAKLTGKIGDETDTTEDGLLEFALRKDGALNIGARLTSTDLKLLNGTSLDMGGETITNVGNVDGRDLSADGSKLDGIEAGADVTDTANVTAAGALMDSEVTNLDQVKAFDSSDYATSAQGILADSATQPGDLGTAASLDVGTTANKVVQLDASARLPAVDASQLTNLPSGATQLSDLSDVNTSTATNRNVLIGDGIDFESRALVEADISDLGTYLTDITGESLSDLSDVATTGSQLDAMKTKLDGIEASADVTPAWVPSVDPTYATETYVDTEVSNLVDAAPGTLDTLNELAAALGDDANFSTTVTNSIATKLPLAGGTMTGNIVMSGSETVDGRDLSVDGTKLDGIEAAADVTDAANVTSAGALMDSEVTNLAAVKAFDPADYASPLGADDNYVTDAEKIVIGNTSGTNTGDQDLSAYQLQPSEGAFVDGDKTKLDGIEAAATADQTAAEIKSLVDSATDSNVFTDADHTKLDGIEASADVTDTTNVVAALTAGSNITIGGDGTISSTDTNDNTQLSDEEVQDIVGAMVTGNTETGITVAYDDLDGTLDFTVASQTDENFTTADHSKLDGISSGADVTPAWVPSSDPSYATQTYVDTEVANLIDAAPGTLDTLNELAAALGDDTNFSTNITNSIATKLPLAGGTMTGNIVMSGSETVDGRDLSVDGAKLDAIEASADVTDTANVTAAGALMDSEVTNIAQVKAFDSSDYATALGADDNYVTDAEKVVIGNTSGTNTGDQDLSSYQLQPSEGAFVDGDKTKLDGIEASADVTDTANVTAAGALMDSEVTNLADVKAFATTDYAAALGADDNYVTDAEKIVIGNTSGANTGDQDLSSYQLQPSEGAFADGDKTKLDTIEASADVTDTANVVSALTAGTNVTIGGDGTISSTAAGTDITKVESQSSHGFAVGELLYDNAGTWTKAQADNPITAEVVGIVTAVDTNDFDLTISGYVSGLAGLTANTLYYLSDSVAGGLTTTEPTANGSISKPVFWATSTTTGYFTNYRGMTNVNSGATTKVETQASHGFAVGDLVYDNAGTWTKAQADDPTTADVIGIVTAVDTDDFDLTNAGYVSGLTGLTANATHFLSDATAGLLTATEPTATGSVSKPVFHATSTTTGYLINYRGMTISDIGGTTRNESQSSHGFAVGELLYDNAGTWTKAQADAEATSDVIGIVTAVDTDDFDLTVTGYISGLSGLTANSAYFLSDTTAGALSLTEPTAEGYVSKPVFWATSTTAGYFTNYRGMVIGNSSNIGNVLISQQIASASSALTFDSVFTSTYDRYIIEVLDLLPATDSVYLKWTWRDASADQFAGSTHYNRIEYTLENGTGSGFSDTSVGHYTFFNNGSDLQGNLANETCQLTIEARPQSTSNHKVLLYNGVANGNDGGGLFVQSGVALIASTSTCDGFKIDYSAGNIASGTVRVWGVPKS